MSNTFVWALIIVVVFEIIELTNDFGMAFFKDIRNVIISENLKNDEDKEQWLSNLLIEVFILRFFVILLAIILISKCI